MLRIAKFEKVSVKQFVGDWLTTFPQQTIEQAVLAYENIRLPRRATSGSAGYDFFAPVGFELSAGSNIKLPTGIRAIIEDGWVLMRKSVTAEQIPLRAEAKTEEKLHELLESIAVILPESARSEIHI